VAVEETAEELVEVSKELGRERAWACDCDCDCDWVFAGGAERASGAFVVDVDVSVWRLRVVVVGARVVDAVVDGFDVG